jgi:2-polyprenyl-3-methyl-5-hydroxy-6-metoxy-1,4-benzoquinol methylase
MSQTTTPNSRVRGELAALVEHQQTLYHSRNVTRRWLHTARRDWIISGIERHCPLGALRVLEVGPGSGLYLPMLASKAKECVATDIEEGYLTNAKLLQDQCCNLRIVKDDITATNLARATFDFILCSEVIEHLSDSRLALRNLNNLLRPGGILILSTPQRYSCVELMAKVALSRPLIGLTRLVYREPVLELGHINLLSERECLEQINGASLTIVERHKAGLYLPLIAEFMGGAGLAFEKWLESRVMASSFDFALWTQYYVLRKEGS